MAVILKKRTAASVPNPDVGKVTLFVDSTDGLPYVKDENGLVTATILTVEGIEDALGNVFFVGGAGLTGTYNDPANTYTFVVGQNADGSIVVNADDIQVGVLATDVQHGNRGGGALHSAVIAAGAAGFMSGTDKSKLDGVATSAAALSGATPTTQVLGDAAVVGVSVYGVHADHKHALTALDDTTHGTRAGGTLHGAATTTVAGFFAANDKKKIDAVYKDIVADFGADPTGVVDCTSIITTALASFSSTGGRLYFPAGTYTTTGLISVSKPIIFCGAGRSISAISITHASNTGFTFTTGAAGAGFEQIRFTAPAASTRTGGFAVDFGAIANAYMQQCDILFQWSGVHSSGALQFIDDMNIREGGANASGGAAILVDSTGDRYIRRLGTDQGSNPTGYAGIRIKECSSCVITDSNIIHSTNALDIVPNAGIGHAVASVYAVNTFFDTSTIGVNIVPASGNDTAQRITFIRCWFGTHTTAGAVINHANVNGVDFVGCEFYQSPFGIDALAATDWSVHDSRFAGNTNAAIRTTAGATHAFTINDNFIGNSAGFGANAQGINIQAGTYKRYQILNNRGFETNTTKGIIDLGVVSTSDQKSVAGNMGGLISGAQSTIGADITTAGTAAFTLLSARIPANSVKIGDTFRVSVYGVTAALGNPTFSVAIGTADPGTTVVWTTAALTSAAANGGGFDALLTVKTIGSSGTVTGSGAGIVAAVIGTSATAAAQTINTTGDWFITARVAMSASTFRAVSASVEAQ